MIIFNIILINFFIMLQHTAVCCELFPCPGCARRLHRVRPQSVRGPLGMPGGGGG